MPYLLPLPGVSEDEGVAAPGPVGVGLLHHQPSAGGHHQGLSLVLGVVTLLLLTGAGSDPGRPHTWRRQQTQALLQTFWGLKTFLQGPWGRLQT